MVIDFLIVGQGICGSLLSWELMEAGASVLVVDEQKELSSSDVASGLMNPVTGKRLVESWRIDELLPAALHTYRLLEQQLALPLLQPTSVLHLFTGREEEALFKDRMAQDTGYLHLLNEKEPLKKLFNFYFDVGVVAPCWLVDVAALLTAWRQRLLSSGALLNGRFQWEDCHVEHDRVAYKGITARKIISCEGAQGSSSPFFSRLPYSVNKGQAVIAAVPGLPRDQVYMHGLKIVPWKQDLFWIGSSFEWKYENIHPTADFKKKVEDDLRRWLKLPFEIVDQVAGIRPASVDYRPFAGLHPQHPAVGILNGTGAKGCSVAPFFARQMKELLIDGKPLLPDASVERFAKLLSR